MAPTLLTLALASPLPLVTLSIPVEAPQCLATT